MFYAPTTLWECLTMLASMLWWAATDFIPVKRCSCCRKLLSRGEWHALPYKGSQRTDDEKYDYDLELRNCKCGSTIGIEHKTRRQS